MCSDRRVEKPPGEHGVEGEEKAALREIEDPRLVGQPIRERLLERGGKDREGHRGSFKYS